MGKFKVVPDSLNVRLGPGRSYKTVCVLIGGTVIEEMLPHECAVEDMDTSKWCPLLLWVARDYLEPVNTPEPAPEQPAPAPTLDAAAGEAAALEQPAQEQAAAEQPGPEQPAPENFYKSVIENCPEFHSIKRCSNPALLEPATRDAVEAIIKEAAADGLELMIFETYRSQELQEIYYDKGVTQLQKVGVHHYGLACDIVKVVDGQPNWDGSFDFLGVYAKKHGLIWGGDWGHPEVPHSFRDMDHVQRVSVEDQEKLFSGEWYPGPG
jgi:hypothetical protein